MLANPSASVRLFVAFAAALGLGLTVLSPSTSRILVWPWAGFAAVGWLLPIGVAAYRLIRRREHALLGGWLDAGFALLALTALASALASPLRGVVLPATLPVLGACALPYALLPLWREISANHERPFLILGVLAGMVLATSLALWLATAPRLGLPAARNPFPFGHGNTLGSFCVLATAWLLACSARTRGVARIGFGGSAGAAALVACSSESRGAVLALGAMLSLAAAIFLLRRGQRLVFALACVAALTTAVATNARLRDFVAHGRWSPVARASNDQRIAMLMGGARLGAERPWLGWGAGAVPHVFPRVRHDLPGSADNFLQLHNSLAQTWATFGALGLVAVMLIAGGLVGAIRRQEWTADRIWIAAGLGGGVTVLLFDHPLDVPAFAVLAAAHLSYLAVRPNAARWQPVAGWICLLLVAPIAFAAGRDLLARASYAAAQEARIRNDAAGYAGHLRRAIGRMPADPYYAHQLAACLATGHPFAERTEGTPEEAMQLLRRSLLANPDLEYAHYNLGWLLIERDPVAAAKHFLRAARLAPQRGEVYLGLGLARLASGDTPGAVRAFATEWLNHPASAWSPFWYDGPLAQLRPEITRLASAALPPQAGSEALARAWLDTQTPAPSGTPFRRLRIGYGVLAGHPDGPPPVDINVQTAVELPPALARLCPQKGWLGGGFLLQFLSASAN